MDSKNELPKRKHPRLDHYDYRSSGAYFVTICTQDRRCLLSRIVGQGQAPVGTDGVEYTAFGRIAEEQLLLLPDRYPCLSIDKYVIMPNHIHAIIMYNGGAEGENLRPTIMDAICTFKSLTTRECRKVGKTDKVLQTSFYEHIIRNREDYEKTVKYICENPMRWFYDELYAEE